MQIVLQHKSTIFQISEFIMIIVMILNLSPVSLVSQFSAVTPYFGQYTFEVMWNGQLVYLG